MFEQEALVVGRSKMDEKYEGITWKPNKFHIFEYSSIWNVVSEKGKEEKKKKSFINSFLIYLNQPF